MTFWKSTLTLLIAALVSAAVACGGGGGLDENGIVKDCKPEKDAPSRVAGDTYTTAGGVEVEVIQSPTADDPAQAGDTITVDYSGSVLGQEPFGDTRESSRPFTFEISTDGAICGWVEGVVGMSIGEVRRLTIPPELAYGDLAFGEAVSPNSTLVFEVERIEPPANDAVPVAPTDVD